MKVGAFAGLDIRGDLAACTIPALADPLRAGRGDGKDDGATELFTGVAGVRTKPFPNLVKEEAPTANPGDPIELDGSFGSWPIPPKDEGGRVDIGGSGGAPLPILPDDDGGGRGEDVSIGTSLPVIDGTAADDGIDSAGVATDVNRRASSLDSLVTSLMGTGPADRELMPGSRSDNCDDFSPFW